MTLFYVETLTPVTTMPRPKDFTLVQARLTVAEFAAALSHVNGLIQGDEIHTSSWMPGADWTNTPLQVLYAKSARLDEGLAAKQFGLLTFYAFMHHPDDWITGRFEMGGEPLRGRTYFRRTY